jgi:hypothetical protein
METQNQTQEERRAVKRTRVAALKLEAKKVNRTRRRVLNSFAKDHGAKETFIDRYNQIMKEAYVEYIFSISARRVAEQDETLFTFRTVRKTLHKCREEKNIWLEGVMKEVIA